MSTTDKKRNPNKKRTFRKPRWDRIIGAGILLSGAIIGGNAIADKVSSALSKNDTVIEATPIYEELDKIDGVIGNGFDNTTITKYYMEDTFSLYAENESLEQPGLAAAIDGEQIINVYNIFSENDRKGNKYVYCEIPSEHKIGLISVSDLTNANIMSVSLASFDQIYIINSDREDIKVSMSASNYSNSGFSLKDGDIVFVDNTDVKKDDKGNDLVKVRNNAGRIGYVSLTDSFELLHDGTLVELKDNVDESKLSILDVNAGERMISIGSSKSADKDIVLYFDTDGFVRTAEIEKYLIQEVDLNKYTDFTQDRNDFEEKFSANSNEANADFTQMSFKIQNWQNNSKDGYFGIDISESMNPNDLEYYLDYEEAGKNTKYGIVKLGAAGYGYSTGKMTYAQNSTVVFNEDKKNITKAQVEVFKKRNIPVFGYFYGTATNVNEGIDLAQNVEQCIDLVDLSLIPILDVEVFQEGKDDRMYFLNNPNYQTYLERGGQEVDLEYMKTLEEDELIQYVDSHPEAINYINFCQEQMAQGIAAFYARLANDGYLNTDEILLYTGNKSVSKNSYKATIKTGTSSFEKIVLFKYDDVQEFLNNPSSPYYINKNVKVWYADYTDSENYKMLGDAVVMHQYDGDAVIGSTQSLYDKNYMCKEFLESFTITQQLDLKDVDTEMEIG